MNFDLNHKRSLFGNESTSILTYAVFNHSEIQAEPKMDSRIHFIPDGQSGKSHIAYFIVSQSIFIGESLS